MATDKYIMISLEDEKVRQISEILGNKTCKKILDFLADRDEGSETDIATSLGAPVNTIEYNLKKLVSFGLVEKAKNFFWSRKGKKIDMYKLAKKHIVISHKTKPSYSKLKTIVPVALISGLFAFIIRAFYNASSSVARSSQDFALKGAESAVSVASESAGAAATGVSNAAQAANIGISFVDKIIALPAWFWFFAGAIAALLIMLGLNWRKL